MKDPNEIPTSEGVTRSVSNVGSNETTRFEQRRALKISEAAASLGVKPITIRRLIERGLLKPCRALRHPLIPVQQIEELLKNAG